MSRTHRPFRELPRPRRTSPAKPGDRSTLPPALAGAKRSQSHHHHPREGGHRAGEFQGYRRPLAQPPDTPYHHSHHRGFAHRRNHRKRGEPQRPEHHPVAPPPHDPHHPPP